MRQDAPLRRIAPSLLSADFGHLAHEVAMLEDSAAEWIHLDVMDGVFVPNISFGFPVIQAVRALTRKVLDAHLMIVHPERYLSQFADAGVNCLTVHYEVCPHLHRVLQQIHQLGMQAGVAINPHTPPELLRDVLLDADLVLLMSVNPGFGGQSYIPSSTERIRRLATLIAEAGSSALIEVDGGIGEQNAAAVWAAGANVLVAGSAVFGSPNPAQAIEAMLRA